MSLKHEFWQKIDLQSSKNKLKTCLQVHFKQLAKYDQKSPFYHFINSHFWPKVTILFNLAFSNFLSPFRNLQGKFRTRLKTNFDAELWV